MGETTEMREDNEVRPAPGANARADELATGAADLAIFIAARAERASVIGPSGDLVDRAFCESLPSRVRRRQRRRLVWAVAGGLATITAAFFTTRAFDLRPMSLGYTVGGATFPRGADVASSPGDEPLFAFSDGTRIQLIGRSRARILAVDQHGALVDLENGRVHIEVVHRPNVDWRFEAGPFVIHVHGTSFFMAWDPELERLDLKMESGVVSVEGPGTGTGAFLRAGQSRSFSSKLPADLPRPDQADVPPSRPVEPPRLPALPAASSFGWLERLGAGQSAAILSEAESRGINHVLASGSSDDLAALSDAARYQRRDSLARRALFAQRRRFPHSTRADDALFLLGRIDDGGTGNTARALAWYERYLHESPRGTYVAEALGRKLMLLAREHRDDTADGIAMDYLRRFPDGPYAGAARSLLAARPR